MVSARNDLAGAIDELNAKLDRLLARVTEEQPEKPISMAEASRRLGMPSRWLAYPWNVPDWKRNGTFHTETEWRRWLASPEVERRYTWEMMGKREREKAAS